MERDLVRALEGVDMVFREALCILGREGSAQDGALSESMFLSAPAPVGQEALAHG